MIDIPFCGPAPIPGMAGWTFDPVVLVALAVLALAGARLAGRQGGAPMALGWTILALALALGVARPGPVAAAGAATAMQMGALGALLMWVPGGLLLPAVMAAAIAALLRPGARIGA